MSTPGATSSGFAARVLTSGPRLENGATASLPSTAPTVRAEAAAAGSGDPPDGAVVAGGHHEQRPVLLRERVHACDSGSLPSLRSQPPRLMFTTSARAAAHSMPATTCDSVPYPSSPSTLPTTRSAPVRLPGARHPSGARAGDRRCHVRTVSKWSTASPPSMLKSARSTTRPARSGWLKSAPVSSTATRTPCPVTPAAQACGALTCFRLRSRSGAGTRPAVTAPVARTRRSNQPSDRRRPPHPARPARPLGQRTHEAPRPCLRLPARHRADDRQLAPLAQARGERIRGKLAPDRVAAPPGRTISGNSPYRASS